MRNGDYLFERCLFGGNRYPLLIASSHPDTLTVTFAHCLFSRDQFSRSVETGITMILNDEQRMNNDEDWNEPPSCGTKFFTNIVADYSAPRSLVAIAHFILLLADGLPLSYLP
jgi:hypothetical protein